VINSSPRLTKQGIRDLNNYGPKPDKAVAAEPQLASDGETPVAAPVSEKEPDAALPAAQ
jgi:hypothetical protein